MAAPRSSTVVALMAVGACAFEWDGYDPRLVPPCEPGTTRACYTGPEGTVGVGRCLPGTETCGDDRRFGPCQDEVGPEEERCDTPTDDDCDGTLLDPENGCVCAAGMVGACYDGPAGTDGIGQCRTGTALCDVTGTMFTGECVGQVLPFVEECITAVDDDCDNNTNDWCGVWSKRFGGQAAGNLERGLALARDGTNVVIGGEINGVADFGGGALTSNGGFDGFVAKFAVADGAYVWSTPIGGTLISTVFAVAIDSAGNAYAAGVFTGTIDLGTAGTLSSGGAEDAFAVKLDSATGGVLWGWRATGTALQRARGIAVNASGQVIVVGEAVGSTTFDGVMTPMAANGTDGFIAILDANGIATGGKLFGGNGIDLGMNVVTDASDNIYLCGNFDTSLDFGSGAIMAGGGLDGFAAKLLPTGVGVWTYPVTGDGSALARSIALDASGDIVVSGNFDGEVDLGGGVRASEGGTDAFALALTGDGDYLWESVVGGAAPDDAHAVAFGPNGTVLLGVSIDGAVQLGGNTIFNAGASDWLFVWLDAGIPTVARRFGDSGDQDLFGIAYDGRSGVLLTGDCGGNWDLGVGPHPGIVGNDDICVGRLAP